jgi:multiple sugar transport system permease protein
MAASTLTLAPLVLIFFFAQRYFIKGIALSGMGGR